MRVLIADDEPLARRALRRLLAAHPDVTLVGEAEDVPSLERMLGTLAHTPPDLLLLDVRMPGGTGFDVIRRLSPETHVVFTTAHAEHAVAAFDAEAVDFLQKPFGAPRLHAALDRVRKRLESPIELVVRIGVRDVPVRVGTIWRIESADDCVQLVTAERTLLHTATMQAMEARLHAHGFLRVHRRHLVNMQTVTALVGDHDRQVSVEFPDGSRVQCSRTGSALVRRWRAARRGS